MPLATRLTALTNAIATAVNARAGRTGASAFDLAVLNGYTGTQAQWFADYQDTSNTDYAGLFNSQLGAISYTGAASESQTGITQFSTSAEVAAATLGTKAVSALQLGGVLRSFATLQAMVNATATTQEGGLAVVGSYVLTGSFSHEHSIWVKTNGKWCVLPGTVIRIGGPAIVGDTITAAGAISSFFSSNTSVMYLHPGVVARTSGATNTSAYPIEVVWSGAAWSTWNATNVQAGWGSVQGGATVISTSANEMNVVNGIATFNFAFTRSAGMGLDLVYWSMIPTWRPAKTIHTAGYTTYQGGTRTATAMRMDPDGAVYLSGNNGAAVDTMYGTFTYRLAQ